MATKTLHDTDFVKWSDETAELIRAGRFEELDIANLADEVKDLGESLRRSVRSQLQRLMMHKLKQLLQPERDGKSWNNSIETARYKILDELEDAASLRVDLEKSMELVYHRALREALRETGKSKQSAPETCPWDLDGLLGTKP